MAKKSKEELSQAVTGTDTRHMPNVLRDNREQESRLFAKAYVSCWEPGEAYNMVFGREKRHPPKTATFRGNKMLVQPNVQRYIRDYQQSISNKIEINTQTVLKEFAKIAFANPVSLFNDDGSLKLPSEWDENTKASVASMDIQALDLGTGNKAMMFKVRLHSKVQALENLAKHLGLYEADNLQRGHNLLDGLPRETVKQLVEGINELRSQYRRLDADNQPITARRH